LTSIHELVHRAKYCPNGTNFGRTGRRDTRLTDRRLSEPTGDEVSSQPLTSRDLCGERCDSACCPAGTLRDCASKNVIKSTLMAFAKARIAVQKALGSDPGMDHRWMRGRHARQKRFQLALAVNLSLIAVGIPIAWNSTVRKKTEAWLAATPDREPEWLQLQREHEQIAIQLLVNERRAKRGLPPYPYGSPGVTADTAAVLESAERTHEDARAQRQQALTNAASAAATLAAAAAQSSASASGRSGCDR